MAIVRNIKTNVLYRYLGEDRYRNLITNEEGIVPQEKAKKIFKINIEATGIFNEYPLAERLVSSLKLKIEKHETEIRETNK